MKRVPRTRSDLDHTYTYIYILPTKTTAARNGVALSYHSVHGLYFLAVVFVATIVNVNSTVQ